jgi:hypothetical protein
MPVDPDDLKVFLEKQGPIHVVAEDQSAISYGTSGRIEMRDPNQDETWTVEGLVLTLFDELSGVTRKIPGDHIEKVRAAGPGFQVVVIDEEPDPGDTTKTRGAA